MSVALITVLIRAAHYAALMLAVGAFGFHYFVALPVMRQCRLPEDVSVRFRRWSFSLVRWDVPFIAATILLWLGAEAVAMSGLPLGQALSVDIVGTVLAQTQFGRIWTLRLALIAILAAVLFVPSAGRPEKWPTGRGALAALLAVALLLTIAWAGHAAAVQGAERLIHLGSHVVHLLAAALWLGGLVPLAYVLRQAARRPDTAWTVLAQRATRRFSRLAVASVVALFATGFVNAAFMVTSVDALTGTAYGRVLLLKLGLFALMLGVAADNRFRLTPRLPAVPVPAESDPVATAAHRLWRNVLIETALGVVLVVGGLGVIDAHAHMTACA